MSKSEQKRIAIQRGKGDIVERLRDWSEGPDTHLLTDEAADVIERLRAEVERQRQMLGKCLLGDPPGDCYAAEVVTLRDISCRLLAVAEIAVDTRRCSANALRTINDARKILFVQDTARGKPQ